MTDPEITPQLQAAWDRNTMHYFAQKTYTYTLKNQRGGLSTDTFLADDDDAAYEHIKACAAQAKCTIHTWKRI